MSLFKRKRDSPVSADQTDRVEAGTDLEDGDAGAEIDRVEASDLDLIPAPDEGAAEEGADQIVSDSRWPIVPLVQPADWLDRLKSQLDDPQWWPLTEDLPHGLKLAFAFDLPDSFELISPRQAKAAGLSPAQVGAAARATLDQLCTGIERQGNAGRYRIELPGHPELTASLILNTASWLNPDDIAGDPVLAIARRDLMHVCGRDDAGSTAGLAALNQSLFEDDDAGSKKLHPGLLTVTAGQLRPL
ncbi:MAG: hypothetical protein LBK42_12410 [Propionibacteriaceae bacterium]|jgi:uncharacterized protein YtpQ (UPF0354 family)|nr:hypothetical protein [Propionibacteriaceae bacterium]